MTLLATTMTTNRAITMQRDQCGGHGTCSFPRGGACQRSCTVRVRRGHRFRVPVHPRRGAQQWPTTAIGALDLQDPHRRRRRRTPRRRAGCAPSTRRRPAGSGRASLSTALGDPRGAADDGGDAVELLGVRSVRCRVAIGRTTASSAAETTMNAISCSDHAAAEQGHAHAAQRAAGEHQQDQVEAGHLAGGEQARGDQPEQPRSHAAECPSHRAPRGLWRPASCRSAAGSATPAAVVASLRARLPRRPVRGLGHRLAHRPRLLRRRPRRAARRHRPPGDRAARHRRGGAARAGR